MPLRTAKTSQNQCGESQGGSLVINLRSRFTAILDSSMVEHAAVNRGVVGSSPTRGGKKVCRRNVYRLYLCSKIFCRSLIMGDYRTKGAEKNNFVSAAAGLIYSGKRFTDNFGEFIEKYGSRYMKDM